MIVDYLNEGGIIPSNNGTMMSSANVSIEAVVTDSFTYDITSNCTFELLSNSTANCTVAFAYPREYTDSGSPNIDLSLILYVDSELTSYLILDWTDIQIGFQTSPSDESDLHRCSFAVFNVTLNAEKARVVQVNMVLDVVSTANSFDFNYAIGTGKYWTGNTSETVRIEVEDRAGLLGLTFHPQGDSIANPTDSTTVAVWSCSVDYFQDFWVGFSAWQHELSTYTLPTTTSSYPSSAASYMPVFIETAFAGCMIGALILLRRRNASL
jgi:hypothetical protein